MLVKLVSRFHTLGATCQVVSLMDEGTQGDDLRSAGASIISLRLPCPSAFLSAPSKLWTCVRSFNPEVIQGWMYHGNLAALLAHRFTAKNPRLYWGIRQSFQGMAFERPLTRQVIRLGAQFSHRPRAIVFNSRVSAGQHASIGYLADRAKVIPNGFELDRFKPSSAAREEARRRLAIPSDALVVGLVARAHPMKDHLGFARAAAMVVKHHPSALFVLAGKGVDHTHLPLMQLLDRLGVARYFRLLGEVGEVENLYPAFDLLVLSSAWGEAFPNVLGEGMVCGIPCVCTDVGDCAEVVNGCGIVVPPRDPEALAGAVSDVLSMPASERASLGALARQRVLDRYSIEGTAATYMELYEA